MSGKNRTEPSARHAAEFPRAARIAGWVVSILMLGYAVDELVAGLAQRQGAASSAAGGMQFDLRYMAIRESLLRWAGAWAWLIGVVWIVAAAVQWRRYGREGRTLARDSKATLAAVACGILLVCGVLAFETLAFGP